MNRRMFKKEIREIFDTIIWVPYCGLQDVLRRKYVIGHTERAEGWGMDVYDLGNGIGLVTGYDTMSGAVVYPPYEVVERYNDEAKKIHWFENPKFEEQLQNILDRFVEEAMNNKKAWRNRIS